MGVYEKSGATAPDSSWEFLTGVKLNDDHHFEIDITDKLPSFSEKGITMKGFFQACDLYDTRRNRSIYREVMATRALLQFSKDRFLQARVPAIRRVLLKREPFRDLNLVVEMEFVGEGNLRELMTEVMANPRIIGPLMGAFVELGKTLDHIYTKYGILHRDLSMTNIRYDRTEDGGFVLYPIDFGSSLHNNDTLPRNSMIATPPFIVPERAKSDSHVSVYSDTYVFYLVMVRSVFGNRIFTAENYHSPMAYAQQLVAKNVRPLNPKIVASELSSKLKKLRGHEMTKKELSRKRKALQLSFDALTSKALDYSLIKYSEIPEHLQKRYKSFEQCAADFRLLMQELVS